MYENENVGLTTNINLQWLSWFASTIMSSVLVFMNLDINCIYCEN